MFIVPANHSTNFNLTRVISWYILGITNSAITMYFTLYICGPASSVGIATDYELDGPGSNPGVDQIFRPSRPAPRPTQPPVKWVPCLSRW